MTKFVTIKYYNTLIALPIIGIIMLIVVIAKHGNCLVENAKGWPVVLALIVHSLTFVGCSILLSLILH